MSDRVSHLSVDYDIRVAEDQLTATVRIEAGGSLDVEHLAKQLTRAGIKSIDHAAITAAAETLRARESQDLPIDSAKREQGLTVVVAKGTPPVQDVPETLVRVLPPEPPDAPTNHYERSQLGTIEPGDVIATITPAVIGHDGVDVFGRIIPRKRVAQPIAPGDGTIRDGETMKADRAGRVKIDGSRIQVDPILTVRGNVSFATGNIRFDGEIHISGSVLDLFVVESTADIHVRGTVEAGQVSAAGDLIIDGGVAGKDKGRCSAGRNIRCRYVDNAHLQAGDEIYVHGEIANSRVVSGGSLHVAAGPILGAHVTANGGVYCRTLGSGSFVKTVVEVGSDLKLKALASELLPQLNKCVLQSQHIKHFAQALLRDPKRLTAEQRDEASRLLIKIGETDANLAAKLEEFRTAHRISQERCRPEVIVEDVIFPGVIIRMPGLMATVTEGLRGPMRIGMTTIDKRQVIAVFDGDAGAVFPLVTYKTARDDTNDVRAILQIAA